MVFVNGPFRKDWGLHLDAQIRSDDKSRDVKTWLVRAGIQRKLNGRNTVALGYAFIQTNTTPVKQGASTPEHRIWQQWIHIQPLGITSLQHRFRLEERFIERPRAENGTGTESVYSTRIRYFNRLVIPWSLKKNFQTGLFASVQNEVFLNLTGKAQINGHHYDQNRFYTALGYRAHRTWDLELGYMRRNIRLQSGSSNQNIWQIATYLRPE